MTKISYHYICEKKKKKKKKKKREGGEEGAQKNRLIEKVLFSAHNRKSQ